MDQLRIPERDDPRLAHYAVRLAVPGDAAGIARVHVDGWKTTYRGIVPDAYLDRLSYRRSYEARRTMLDLPPAGHCTLVATDPIGWVVGFADLGPARDALGFDGELYALYVMKAYQRLGLGAWLLETAARAHLAAGRRSMLLWVLAANHPARRFYEAFGGEALATKLIAIGGAPLEEIAYGWRDLAALIEAP
ncbi:MAG: GNAT family N-acetyltransferase [Chloroflexota bacterium]|nr:GNAT family N-acetyltransferase [Dehalococcoidia bacterium]MDW8252541.1 GNAT family N-acetyltransferase [Chloroflexota bacterium]